MSNAPLMPMATAVWLVENTTLTFKQIADFCNLHEVEVQGIADCELQVGTKVFAAYRKKNISERHRHRYEVNNRYRKKLENNGLIFSGLNMELGVIETVEIQDHPWFVAGQFHP